MTNEEVCEAYELDPDGQHTYEAIDRIEQLKGYLDIDYLDTVGAGSRDSTEEFSLASESLFAQDSEAWAFQCGLEKVAALAMRVNSHLRTLESFCNRLIRVTRAEYVSDNGILPWEEEVEAGEYDPGNVIDVINGRMSSEASTAGLGMDYGDGIYSFVSKLLADAHSQYGGDFGRALSDRFQFSHPVRWFALRGVQARIFPLSQDFDLWQIEVFNGPERLPRIGDIVAPTESQAMDMLRVAVDSCWAQIPDLEKPFS
jgi:hypothetical protein